MRIFDIRRILRIQSIRGEVSSIYRCVVIINQISLLLASFDAAKLAGLVQSVSTLSWAQSVADYPKVLASAPGAPERPNNHPFIQVSAPAAAQNPPGGKTIDSDCAWLYGYCQYKKCQISKQLDSPNPQKASRWKKRGCQGGRIPILVGKPPISFPPAFS